MKERTFLLDPDRPGAPKTFMVLLAESEELRRAIEDASDEAPFDRSIEGLSNAYDLQKKRREMRGETEGDE